MNYIQANKEAWEEAFDNKRDGWGENVVENLNHKADYYIAPVIKNELDKQNLSGKKIAQFCCNNGRELLSIIKYYKMQGVGFDIAQNLISQGKQHADQLHLPCQFIAKNILDIESTYYNSFDVIIFTIGAITWFENLDELFAVVTKCLVPNGIMILHDFHPVMNMLALPGEERYQEGTPEVIEHTYFMKEPWIENNGMDYISGEYSSKTFTSFSHSISDIINSVIKANMKLLAFNEYDYDVGLSKVYDNMGLPLSMLLVSAKQ